MDITPYLEMKIAPRAVFDSLARARARVRASWCRRADGDWRAVTWGAFAEQIRDIALSCAGGADDAAIARAIFAPNRVEWVSAALAIQAAGGVMVPIYPASTPEQAAYVRRTATRRWSSSTRRRCSGALFEAWSELRRGRRASCSSTTRSTPARVATELREQGRRCRRSPRSSASVVAW